MRRICISRLKKSNTVYLLVPILSLFVIYFTGWLEYPRELSFDKEFTWPLDRSDLKQVVEDIIDGNRNLPKDVSVINPFLHKFIIKNENKCKTEKKHPQLVIVIKSALTHLHHRDSIRSSWGNETRFNGIVKRIFVTGSCDFLTHKESLKMRRDPFSMKYTPDMKGWSCTEMINRENQLYNDIVQVDFADTYFNNTIKATAGFKWLTDYCPDAEFAFFVDDDFYVSVKNLLSFIQNPLDHPNNKLPDAYLPFDDKLFAGFVVFGRHPQRLHSNKWYTSLDQYPFDRYPDFIEAGAFVVSNRVFKEIYVATAFVKPFPFDDNYLGIVSKKIDLKLVHNVKFVNDHQPYDSERFSDVIAFHGVGDYKFVNQIWKEQMAKGNA